MAAREVLARAEQQVGILASDVVTVPHLKQLFPEGLRPGSITVVQGSTSLLWTVTAAAMRESAWVAVVGLPHVGWEAAAAAGIDLQRTTYVPQADPQELAACIDGYSVVVVGAVELTEADKRSLAGRVRAHRTIVLSVTAWPGARAVRAAYSGAVGCAHGAGALAERSITARRTDRPGDVPLCSAQQVRVSRPRRLMVVS